MSGGGASSGRRQIRFAGGGVVLSFLLLLATPPLAAQGTEGAESARRTTAGAASSPDSTGYVAGYIYDDSTRVPVAAASVSLPDLGRRTLTDVDGGFAFENVPVGTHLLRVRHIRYGMREVEISVEAGQRIGVELGFSPRAIELEPVTVSVRAMNPDLVGTGFYRRRLSGRSGFFGDETFVSAPARRYKTVPEALMQTREVLINQNSCVGAVFLNGRPYDPGFVRDYSRDLAGLEIYGPSDVPEGILEDLAAYRVATRGLPRHPAAGDVDEIHRMKTRINRCGIILLWTDRDGAVFGEGAGEDGSDSGRE